MDCPIIVRNAMLKIPNSILNPNSDPNRNPLMYNFDLKTRNELILYQIERIGRFVYENSINYKCWFPNLGSLR